jgi:hypothetical protein
MDFIFAARAFCLILVKAPTAKKSPRRRAAAD